jgi:hypothetical protein
VLLVQIWLGLQWAGSERIGVRTLLRPSKFEAIFFDNCLLLVQSLAHVQVVCKLLLLAPRCWKDHQVLHTNVEILASCLTHKTHCNHPTFLQKKLYHNFWLYSTFLGCHILTFSFYRLLNVYTKNPGLPPRADVL